jgi:DNA polymerase alpha subunit B
VIATSGINANGTAFIAERLLAPARMPHVSVPLKQLRAYNRANTEPLDVMVAAGPFTPNCDLGYAPLLDLLKVVAQRKPHALLLIGPFLDEKHPKIAKGDVKESFGNAFLNLLRDVVEHTRSIRTRVLIMPSLKDVHHEPVLPQPAFDVELSEYNVAPGKLTFLPNPAVFSVNDVTFGAVAEDILLHLSQNSISRSAAANDVVDEQVESKRLERVPIVQDRVLRIATHLVQQHSFYPLFPAPHAVNVDHTLEARLQFPVTPDVLIVPSKLKRFAATLGEGDCHPDDEVVCVNPATLAKGMSGGTYATISVHARKDLAELSGSGNKNPMVTRHCVAARTRVDIVGI